MTLQVSWRKIVTLSHQVLWICCVGVITVWSPLSFLVRLATVFLQYLNKLSTGNQFCRKCFYAICSFRLCQRFLPFLMKCIWRDSVRYTCIEKLYIPVCWAKFSRGWFYSGSFLFFHEMNVNLLYRLTVTLFDIAHPVSSLDADNIPQFIILKSFFNVKFSDLYSHIEVCGSLFWLPL